MQSFLKIPYFFPKLNNNSVLFTKLILQHLFLLLSLLDFELQLIIFLAFIAIQLPQPHNFSAHKYKFIFKFPNNLLTLSVDLDTGHFVC